MTVQQLEKLRAMVRAVRAGDARKGGGPGREQLDDLEAAISADLDVFGGPGAGFAGLHLRRFAPSGTPAVALLTVELSRDLEVCRFKVDATEGASREDAAAVAHRLGWEVVKGPPDKPVNGKGIRP